MTNEVKINDNQKLECSIAQFTNIDFKLDSGTVLENLTIAYKTFGKLNEEKSNAILACHALTGDQYVTEANPITKKDGWWSRMVGPNKPIDTKGLTGRELAKATFINKIRFAKEGTMVGGGFPLASAGD